MTGFRIIVRGCSLTSASVAARRMICGSQMDRACVATSEYLTLHHQQMLDDRPEAEGWEERQRAHDHDDADEHRGEQWSGHGKRAWRRRNALLASEIARDRQHRQDHEEAS